MTSAGDVLGAFYAAVKKKDIASARRYLNSDLFFVGLFETYHQIRNGKIARVESVFDGRPFAGMFRGGR
jgi:hypothetical protein